jgi:hypothetical protein
MGTDIHTPEVIDPAPPINPTGTVLLPVVPVPDSVPVKVGQSPTLSGARDR